MSSRTAHSADPDSARSRTTAARFPGWHFEDGRWL